MAFLKGMYFYILLYILYTYQVKCFEMPQTWVNPSDFHHSRKTEHSSPVESSPTGSTLSSPENETEPETVNLDCICPAISKNACGSYLTRVLNKILIRGNLKNFRLPKEGIRIVPLTLYFNAKNLEIIQHFAAEDDQDTYSWSDFDDAFNSIFTIPTTASDEGIRSTQTNEEIIEERDYALFFFITIVSAVLIIGLWLFLKSGSIFKSFGGIYLVTFSIALVWNLIRAYKVEKAKILLDTNLLKKGMANRTGWKNYVPGAFLRFFDIDDELLLPPQYDPMINVDFGAIVIETFFSFLNVLPILGTKIGQMTHNFYAEQNFIIRYILSTISFLLNPFIFGICILLIIAIQKGIFLKIPMFALSIGQSPTQALPFQRQAIQDDSGRHRAVITCNNKVEKFYGATHSETSHEEEEPSTSKTKSRYIKYPMVVSRKGRVRKRRIVLNMSNRSPESMEVYKE